MQRRHEAPESKTLLRFRGLYQDLYLTTVPLRAQSKRPLRLGWQNPNPERWANVGPKANLGVLTGAPSENLLVLDLDNPERTDEIFHEPPQAIAERTLVVTTSRGFHVYTRTEQPVANRQLPHGAGDLKSQGGLVVAPPSIHPSGTRYAFAGDAERICDLADLDLTVDLDLQAATQPPPGRVEANSRASPELIRRVEAFVREQAPKFRRKVRALREGRVRDRSGAEFMLAKGMAEAGFSDDQIGQILLTWGQKAPQRAPAYLRRTIARARQAALSSPAGHRRGGEN
jgi:hypothetical protein